MSAQNVGIQQTLQGHYKVGVVNAATDEVSWVESGSNLIINSGMDNLYNMSVADQMTYGICGVGTRPNNQASGNSQISQSGNTVFLSNTSGFITDFTSSFNVYPNLVQAGDMISCSNGQQLVVTAVPDGFHLTVTPAATFAAQGFAVYKTSQVGLQSELSRSGPGIAGTVYLTGAGNCGTTITGSFVTHMRTYDFNPLTAQQSFNEVGIGWQNSGSANVFSRILLGSPVTVFAGFKLRLAYQLNVTYGPTGSIFGAASIGGWPVGPSTTTNGTQSAQVLLCSTIDNSGNSQNNNAVLDPYFLSGTGTIAAIFASTNSASLAPFGSAVDRTTSGVGGTQMTKASYTIGTYICDKTGIITAGALSTNAIRSIGFGITGNAHNPFDAVQQAFCFVFDQPQTVVNTQTLSLTFRNTWGRILG